MAVYFTLLKPGDTVLGMNLAHGGHLTHGHPLNFSGKLYTIVPYGVRKDDERIDYEELERLAHEHKPKMIMVGASAYPRVIDFERIGRVGTRRRRAGRHRHGAHRRPGRRRRAPEPGAALRLRHDDDAQDAARARAAAWSCAARSTRRTSTASLFPGVQGGPLMHIIAAKAVCFKEALEPGFADYQRQIVANAAASGGEPVRRRVPAGERRHRQPPDARRRVLEGPHRQGRRGGARQGRASPSTRTRSRSTRTRRWSRAASAIGTPAITTRGMREPEMDVVAELIARALRVAGRRRGAGDGARRKSRPCAGSSRCTREPAELTPRRSQRRASRPGGSAGAGARRLRAAPGAARDGRRPSPTSSPTAACCSPKRAPAPARRSPTSSPPSCSRAARARLDRHQEPAGADLLQGPAGPAASRWACRSPPPT